MQNLFIIGAPGSGTGAIAKILASDPRFVLSKLDDEYFEKLQGELIESGKDSSEDMRAAIAARADEIGALLSEEVPGAEVVLVESSSYISMYFDVISKFVPEFKVLYAARRPISSINSSVVAWRTRKFAADIKLDGWWGEPWAFALVDGWKQLIGAPLAKVCATQWSDIVGLNLESLKGISEHNLGVIDFEKFLKAPGQDLRDVLARLELGSFTKEPQEVAEALATIDQYLLAPISMGSSSEIFEYAGQFQERAKELNDFLAAQTPEIIWEKLELGQKQKIANESIPSAGTAFSSTSSSSLAQILFQAKRSLIISTYKSGHIIVARSDGKKLDTQFNSFNRPMGIAVSSAMISIGVADSIYSAVASSNLAKNFEDNQKIDAVYTPKNISFTGDIAIHDMAYDLNNELYAINTKFSCLVKRDFNYSFVPVWKPDWITAYSPNDRCHLNGLGMVNGKPKYVTALGQTNTPAGWREKKGSEGLIIDIETNRIVTSTLSMPHSPRWYQDQLWVLESGKGTIAKVDVETGEVTTVATLPGFTRGLSFIGPFALIGLSQVRESVFSSLPITEASAERNCGVWVVDIRSGEIVGQLRFEGAVQEIFDVQVLPFSWPHLLQNSAMSHNTYTVPDEFIKLFSEK